MKEADYINATNLTKVRMISAFLRDIIPDGKRVIDEERSFMVRAADAWMARLERAVSYETRMENKEPWRVEWPKPEGE